MGRSGAGSLGGGGLFVCAIGGGDGVGGMGCGRGCALECIHSGEWTEMSLPAAHNGSTH